MANWPTNVLVWFLSLADCLVKLHVGHFSHLPRFTGIGFCLLCLLRPKMVLFIVTTRHGYVCCFRKQCLVYCHFPSGITFVHLCHSFTFFTSQFFIIEHSASYWHCKHLPSIHAFEVLLIFCSANFKQNMWEKRWAMLQKGLVRNLV